MPVFSLLAFVLRVRSGLKVRLWDPYRPAFSIPPFPKPGSLKEEKMESDLPL